jgi:3-dehydroquinate synthase
VDFESSKGDPPQVEACATKTLAGIPNLSIRCVASVLHFLAMSWGSTRKNQRRKRMKKISVRAENGKYEVLCGRGVLRELPRMASRIRPDGEVFVVSSARVWRHWGTRVGSLLRGASKATILMDDAETAKNLLTVEQTCRDLVRAGADRRSLVVAVGGGVVGDVAGFVAASYARGIALIHVPTTVVAQVDSAIGGKTGVNLPEGKNLVGAFFPPKGVVADPVFLSSLPPREFRSGIYEIIKYGVIGDLKLFQFLERKMGKILRRERPALAFAIERSIQQKARIVSEDEHEAGLREILNFGHTFAHALESVTRYKTYLHGEAVGLGMIAAARLAVEKGMLTPREEERIGKVIACVGPLPPWPSVPAGQVIAAMQADKKTRAGRLRFVLPERIGATRCGVDVEEEMLTRVLLECSIAAAPSESRKARR